MHVCVCVLRCKVRNLVSFISFLRNAVTWNQLIFLDNCRVNQCYTLLNQPALLLKKMDRFPRPVFSEDHHLAITEQLIHDRSKEEGG